MGKIIRNGIEYGGTYDSATSVNYDNSVSGLNARTVQEGIDQLNERLESLMDYSTEEKAVGTWFDGSTIYKKTIVTTTSSKIGDNFYIIDGATNIIKLEGYLIDSYGANLFLPSYYCVDIDSFGFYTKGGSIGIVGETGLNKQIYLTAYYLK